LKSGHRVGACNVTDIVKECFNVLVAKRLLHRLTQFTNRSCEKSLAVQCKLKVFAWPRLDFTRQWQPEQYSR